MRCFQFHNWDKKEDVKTPNPNSEQSSFTDRDIRQSGTDFSYPDASDTSTESRGRTQFPNLSDRPSNLKVFTFSELKQATKNFSRTAKLGEGGFGCVFKGVIKDSEDPTKKVDVAVKQLGRRGLQGHKEWVTEVNVLGVVEHPNLVKLIGYCAEDDERGIQRLLIYEYMPEGSVEDHLSSKTEKTLTWARRLRIALDTAKGLTYLHEEMDFQIIFRDFKSSNILLDDQWNAKLSDFGLARLGPPEGLTHVSTAVVGTMGYAAPEYIQTGRLTSKSDVWSYGVFLYELITGRRPLDRNRPRSEQKLLEWVKPYLSDSRKFQQIMDPRLERKQIIKSAHKLSLVANRCLSRLPKARPKMSEVLEMVNQVIEASTGIGNPEPPLTNKDATRSYEESETKVLQLCYNKLTGNVPTQLGSLKKLNVLALQFNHLTGAIPASLGELMLLTRLDLSFNHLFGSIPLKLATLPLLKIFDIRNNSLSGNVPLDLKRLDEGFQYGNNTELCGSDFPPLKLCLESDHSTKPFGASTSHLPSKDIPESANVLQNGSTSSKKSHPAVVTVGVIGLIVAVAVTGVFSVSWYRRNKQKIGSTFDSSDSRLSTDQIKEVRRRSASPLISLEYSNGWDPLAKQQDVNSFSGEVLESYMYNLDEVESATQYFSEANLLGKSSFSAIYKGTLRDGSIVAIKCISKISCKSDEAEFLQGLKLLISLKHENLLRLRGFCCSKGRGECFLIYDFVPNGNLLKYLDLKEGKGKVLEWPSRKSIIKGIAKGIEYLHQSRNSKPTLVHRNISAEKVLINRDNNPVLADSGIHKLLADDIIFSTLKGSAAMGYLAPEYTTTGQFTEKSDVYAFGMIIFQILSGKSRITQLNCHGAELSRFEDFIDVNLAGKFKESEAAKLGELALACTHESPNHRPDIGTVMQELDDICSDHFIRISI